MSTKLIISGSTGKMGMSLISSLNRFNNFNLVYSASSSNDAIPEADIIIDFSEPSFSLKILGQAVQKKIPMLIGTTGFSKEEFDLIKESSRKIPILFAPNTSLGIFSLKKMIFEALPFINSDTEITISETHHKDKKDSPSGTALEISSLLKKDLSLTNSINIQSFREDDSSGQHTIKLKNKFEEITLTHQSFDRRVYSDGAYLAAKWLLSRDPGLYQISDIYLSKNT